MSRPVLVADATKRGSTAEVAEAVAATLREKGLEVEAQPAAKVDDLGAYDGVVLGGALYIGRWHSDARRFLDRHRKALAALPVAVFGIGPRTLEEQAVEEARVSVAISGGVTDPAKLPLPFSRMPATDARHWDAIHTWAAEVAAELGARQVAAASR